MMRYYFKPESKVHKKVEELMDFLEKNDIVIDMRGSYDCLEIEGYVCRIVDLDDREPVHSLPYALEFKVEMLNELEFEGDH